jgi:hypothetical protein
MPRLLAVLLVLAVAGGTARANYGPGGWNGEPTGLEHIQILREQLTIDLRALDGSRPAGMVDGWPMANVEVTYEVWNAGNLEPVELVFVDGNSGAPKSEIRVFLDDRPIEVGEAQIRADRVARWTPPENTPAVRGQRPHVFGHRWGPANGWSIALTFPLGRSTLRTSYRTPSAANTYESPTAIWQFVYLLAPARDWAGFGGLDVTVYVPPGWLVAAEPGLRRDGDVLTASFDEMPADSLTFSLCYLPRSLELQIIVCRWIGYVLAVLAPIVIFWRWRRVGRMIAARYREMPELIRLFNRASLLTGLGSLALALLTAWMLTVGPIAFADIPRLQHASWGVLIPMLAFMFIGIPASIAVFLAAPFCTRIIARRQLQRRFPTQKRLPLRVSDLPAFPNG